MKKTICTLALAALLSGCGSDDANETAEQSQEATKAAEESSREVVRREDQEQETAELERRPEVDAEKRIPRMDGESEEEGYGLTMMVDGSSPEAFQESLELIAMDTSQEQYRQLDSALRFLGTYDTAAWGGLPNLYKSLDGMTGEEIIERARNMREEQRRK